MADGPCWSTLPIKRGSRPSDAHRRRREWRLPAAANRASVLEATGRLGEAVTQFEDLHRRYPSNLKLLVRLANAHNKAGNPSAALQRVREALDVDPNHAAAQQLRQQLENPTPHQNSK